MSKFFSILILAIGIMAFSGVHAENKGSPCAIEKELSQSYIYAPAFASTDAIQFSEITATDIPVFAESICLVTSPAQTQIAVYSGQGFWRCGSIYNDEINYEGAMTKRVNRLHKPGHNHIARL